MEHKELTTVADELAQSLYNVLGVLKTFDNGENCPSCGFEYSLTCEDESAECTCYKHDEDDCYLVQAENLLTTLPLEMYIRIMDKA